MFKKNQNGYSFFLVSGKLRAAADCTQQNVNWLMQFGKIALYVYNVRSFTLIYVGIKIHLLLYIGLDIGYCII